MMIEPGSSRYCSCYSLPFMIAKYHVKTWTALIKPSATVKVHVMPAALLPCCQAAIASLHYTMTGRQSVNGLCRRAHIIQRLDALSGQYFSLVQIRRDYLGQWQ